MLSPYKYFQLIFPLFCQSNSNSYLSNSINTNTRFLFKKYTFTRGTIFDSQLRYASSNKYVPILTNSFRILRQTHFFKCDRKVSFFHAFPYNHVSMFFFSHHRYLYGSQTYSKHRLAHFDSFFRLVNVFKNDFVSRKRNLLRCRNYLNR